MAISSCPVEFIRYNILSPVPAIHAGFAGKHILGSPGASRIFNLLQGYCTRDDTKKKNYVNYKIRNNAGRVSILSFKLFFFS